MKQIKNFFKNFFSCLCCYPKKKEYEVYLNDFYEPTEIDTVLHFSQDIDGEMNITEDQSWI